jgi:N-acyl-D-amino-acid deacylase
VNRTSARLGLAATLIGSLAVAPSDVAAQGKRVEAHGHSDPRTASFDILMIRFLEQTRIPGAALAVVKNGRLIHARGYGVADAETGEPVRPESLFRIASVSKPITSAAIMMLVEHKKLRLDEKVFDRLQLETKAPPGAKIDPRWRQVTIGELLQHRGGWDRDKSFDPMFRPVEFARAAGGKPPADQWQVIRAMLGHPLDFDPGTRDAYSNFGYCLLGRVVEAASGETYEEYVRKHVLAPLGVRDMRIGHTLPEGRAPGEVRYHGKAGEVTMGRSVFAPHVGQPVPWPYGAWHLEAMDAHGGWIASAIDLVRFAWALDETSRHRILDRASVHATFARAPGLAGHTAQGRPKDAYYGFGWNVRPVAGTGRANTWHTGLLDGTSTILVRRFDGLAWAVLFNASVTADGKEPAGLIDPLVHEAADAVRQFPEGNLFPSYFPVQQSARNSGVLSAGKGRASSP